MTVRARLAFVVALILGVALSAAAQQKQTTPPALLAKRENIAAAMAQVKDLMEIRDTLETQATRIRGHIKNLLDLSSGLRDAEQGVYISFLTDEGNIVLEKISHAKDLVTLQILAIGAAARSGTQCPELRSLETQISQTADEYFQGENLFFDFTVKSVAVSLTSITNQAALMTGMQLRDAISSVQDVISKRVGAIRKQ